MDVPVKNKFAILLAEKGIKEKRNIPIAEVSRITGISRPTLKDWQSNNVTRFDVQVIDQLCKYFGVGLGDLLEYVAE
jgi:DNA-binding Xre family transcriptional regulator